MSYCRWSSDNFACDLYCYEDVNGGFTTHVARNRVVGDVPKFSLNEPKDELFAAYRKQMAWLTTAKREPIGLPFDGESFNDPDLESFLARLLNLAEAGYHFPASVIKTVRDELQEQMMEEINKARSGTE